ncbi:MAG TPA: hypothetical protein VHB21_16550, partial [Minicystis sp.]|nr:hypothetical protein [Minicystis sp.]
MTSKLSRRAVLGVIGSGAVAAPLFAAVDARAGSVSREEQEGDQPIEALVAGVGPGTKLAGAHVLVVEPLDGGAIGLLLAAPDGEPFRLEIMRRDPSPVAPRAPGESERF